MEIRRVDVDEPQVLALLRLHLAGMYEHSPAEHVHALDVAGLESPDVTFVGAWDDGSLTGFGALKELTTTHGELKSMRTSPDHLRRSVGAHIMEHLLGVARARGYRRVSLETGSGAAFAPAIELYRRAGFVVGDPFDAYVPSEFSQFMHLHL